MAQTKGAWIGADAIKARAAGVLEENLVEGREISFTVQTKSMRPMLEVGDKLIVRSVAGQMLNEGDIVLRKTENGQGWLAHRLIGRIRRNEDLWLVTKGDNTPNADEAWAATELSGAAVGIRSGSRQASLLSRRAKWVSYWVARVSRWQTIIYQPRPELIRSTALKLSGLLLYASARTARYVAGLG